jgi:ubiquinone/menaquinone biosynthesis C-methylase UbiE
MLSPSLYKNSRVYDFFMKSLGYERSLDRIIRHLPLDQQGPLRILDAGCGTGLLGLGLLQRFPKATLIATDLEPNFLKATLSNARSRGIDSNRLQVGLSNITHPLNFTTLEDQVVTIPQQSLQLICIGAVVGYSNDIEASLRMLVELLSPGGTLINIEMNENLLGRYVSKRYHYRNLPLSRMVQVLSEAGCDVVHQKLNLRHLPAKFTRTAILATKQLA